MNQSYEMPKYIVNQKGIYEFIANLYKRYKFTTNSTIILDCKYTKLIESNLMAPLGLVLTKIKSQSNTIFFRGLNNNLKSNLIKYGFLDSANFEYIIPQNFIKYECFSGDDVDGFNNYLQEQLEAISNIETITSLKLHLTEIFINVKMHGRTSEKSSRYKSKEVFTSGYYNKDKDYVLFSIANNGQTFSENLKLHLDYDFKNQFNSIQWSLIESNTSTSGRPGGLGLAMVKELVEQCKGHLCIFSGKGFYELNHDHHNNESKEFFIDLTSPFPGTVVTIRLPLSNIINTTTPKSNITVTAKQLLQGDVIDVYNLLHR